MGETIGRRGYDDGGGVTPPAYPGANPQVQQLYQRYASLPLVTLQQLAARTPQTSAQGQLIQHVLKAKQINPAASGAFASPAPVASAAAPAGPVTAPGTAPQPSARGGGIRHFDGGGGVVSGINNGDGFQWLGTGSQNSGGFPTLSGSGELPGWGGNTNPPPAPAPSQSGFPMGGWSGRGGSGPGGSMVTGLPLNPSQATTPEMGGATEPILQREAQLQAQGMAPQQVQQAMMNSVGRQQRGPKRLPHVERLQQPGLPLVEPGRGAGEQRHHGDRRHELSTRAGLWRDAADDVVLGGAAGRGRAELVAGPSADDPAERVHHDASRLRRHAG